MQLMLPKSWVPEWQAAEIGGIDHTAVGMGCTQVSKVQGKVLEKNLKLTVFHAKQ